MLHWVVGEKVAVAFFHIIQKARYVGTFFMRRKIFKSITGSEITLYLLNTSVRWKKLSLVSLLLTIPVKCAALDDKSTFILHLSCQLWCKMMMIHEHHSVILIMFVSIKERVQWISELGSDFRHSTEEKGSLPCSALDNLTLLQQELWRLIPVNKKRHYCIMRLYYFFWTVATSSNNRIMAHYY